MRQLLQNFNRNFGDRGIMFVLFACSVVIHSILSMNMELLSVHPDEIGTAATAAFYAGKDWSGIMEPIGYYYGYVQALFYTPLMLMFKNPYAQYKAMLVMNGVIVSFIPLVAYHIASKISELRAWHKLVIAAACGFYTSYMVYSKFIWNEAMCSLMPWFLIWCVYMAWERRDVKKKCAYSVLTGFFCAFSFGAHPRLIAVVIALVVTLLIARYALKENILSLPVFFSAMAVSFVAEHFACTAIKDAVWGGPVLGNTPENEISRIGGLLESDGIERLLSTFFGHLYSFFSSTAGLGALALVFLFALCYTNIKEWKKDFKAPIQEAEDNTKEYRPIVRTYSHRLIVMSIYGALAIGGSMLLSVLFKFNSDKLESIKDLTIFARYTENTAPLAIFLVLIVIFLYGYSWRHMLWAVGIYAVTCGAFGVLSYPTVEAAGSYRELSVISILALRFSEDITHPFTKLSFVIISSIVFSVLAMLTVAATCTRRFKTQFAAGIISAVFMYTTLFAGGVYLPVRKAQSAGSIRSAIAVSNLIYNDKQSPDVVTVGVSTRIASLVQFINQDISVNINGNSILPENCVVIAANRVDLPYSEERYDIIGSTGEYTVYAFGEQAKDYYKYRHSADSTAVKTVEE